jgi:ferric-dicitrate binding protein FerR (iron transport regulator)
MRKQEDLQAVFDRIARGEATDEDLVTYNRWCNASQKKGLPVPDIGELKPVMWAEIQARLHHNSASRRLKLWTKVAAAAAVILAVSVGGYYLSRPPQASIAVDQIDTIAPGGSKATLILANGQSIVLDSTGNRQLTNQGSSQVVKVDSGLLSYSRLTSRSSAASIVSYNTLTVPRGGQYRLVLADGTRVWLNASSSIRFPTAFIGKEREVTISGEVYMEVAEDASHPFIVTTAHSTITVLGTRFNVMAYDNEPAVTTTLLEGSVKVSVPGTRTAMIIRPDQQASVDRESEEVRVKTVNASNVAAWIHGLISLKDCTVKELMGELSRWYDVDVEYAGAVPVMRFGGMINRNTDLTNVLSGLNEAGIHTLLKNRKIIVLAH